MRQIIHQVNETRWGQWAAVAFTFFALSIGAASQPQPGQAQSSNEEQEQSGPQRVLIVSIPDRQLALLQDGRILQTYAVAVGAAETPTPAGEFTIINRLENPTYYKPGTVIEPGPANPLGSRWMGLNAKSYGIHGTNVPSSIGKAASTGCIRLGRREVEELFRRVRVGDRVVIYAERNLLTAAVFGRGIPQFSEAPMIASAILPNNREYSVLTGAAGGQD